MNKNTNNKLAAAGLVLGLVFSFLIILPSETKADFSLCLFNCGKEKETVVNNVTNVNSNVNSPGSTVNAQDSTVNLNQTVSASGGVMSNVADTYGYNRPHSIPAPVPAPAVTVNNNVSNNYSYSSSYEASRPYYDHSYSSYYSAPSYHVSVSSQFAYQTPVRYVQPLTYVQPIIKTPVVYQPTVLGYNNGYGLDAACFADPINAKIGQPVTWTAEVTGGLEPYTYSWTGSDGLSGTQKTALRYYGSTGSKNAYVAITSADGRTITKICANEVKVTAVTKAPVKKTAVQTQAVSSPAPVSATAYTAASMLSLSNVPWGMVAIIIIIMLLFAVIYLIFNKNKI